MKTKVGIIGGGPAGLMLSQMLHRNGVDNVVLEKHTREHVLGRIRAGVLEWGSVELLRDAGVGDRMDRDGEEHDSIAVAWSGKSRFSIDTKKFTGKGMMVYGQTQITEDLYEARNKMGGTIIHEAKDVALHALDSETPYITYIDDGESQKLECEFIAGCDGFHGPSRQAIPNDILRTYENVYPFGWLGVLSETPPLHEIMYANHPDGFALASKRHSMLSRYYIQCALDARIEDWPDDRFWKVLKSRFPKEIADQIVTGPSVEKSIAPLRSFVAEPMSYERLFLAGDSAHIVPPTGAKGLNLAFSDVYYLSRALLEYFEHRDDSLLKSYSDTALKRVWNATRFSWYMTTLLHRFPDQTDFSLRTQEVELDYISESGHAQASICEQFIGLPF